MNSGQAKVVPRILEFDHRPHGTKLMAYRVINRMNNRTEVKRLSSISRPSQIRSNKP